MEGRQTTASRVQGEELHPTPSAAAISRVLVPVDRHPESRDALAFGRALSARLGADLLLAPIRAERGGLEGGRSAADGQVASEAIGALTADPRSSAEVLADVDAREIPEVAFAAGADLIVIGAAHRDGLGASLPGGVAERALGEAPCAVAVAPRGLAERTVGFDHIAIGYDRSRESRAALRTASWIASQCGARLSVLSAVEVGVPMGGIDATRLRDEEEERMTHDLAETLAAAPAAVAVGSPRMLHGPAERVVPDAASGADLLVLGSRAQYGPAFGVRLGSIAAKALLAARYTVLITPAS